MPSPIDVRSRAVGCAAVVAVLVVTALPARAELTGAAQIIDGNTLEVAGQRVELFGIDAPDLDQVCRHAGRDYECGKVARAALWDLVAGLDVVCTPEPGVPTEDGVVVATCTAGGFSLNENMVHTGWALADRQASDRYVAKEEEAKEARRGLWRGEFDLPWEWRQIAPATGESDGATTQ